MRVFETNDVEGICSRIIQKMTPYLKKKITVTWIYVFTFFLASLEDEVVAKGFPPLEQKDLNWQASDDWVGRAQVPLLPDLLHQKWLLDADSLQAEIKMWIFKLVRHAYTLRKCIWWESSCTRLWTNTVNGLSTHLNHLSVFYAYQNYAFTRKKKLNMCEMH